MIKRVSSLFVTGILMLIASVCLAQTGIISTYVTLPTGDYAFDVAPDNKGNLYYGSYTTYQIKKISPTGTIKVIAGTGTGGYTGDGGPATAANIYYPADIAIDRKGNLYFSDDYDNVVRKIDTSGIITTVVGSSGPLVAGFGITVDDIGNIYAVDFENNYLRKLDTSGQITIVAGTGVAGYSGDGGPATAATFSNPLGVAVDAKRNIYISDGESHVIRKIDTAGIITTFAGTGVGGYSLFTGVGPTGVISAPATSANIEDPFYLKADKLGNIYFADDASKALYKIDTAGIMSIVLSDNSGLVYSGDGGPSVLASWGGNEGFGIDSNNNLFVPDFYSFHLRKITNSPNYVADSFVVDVDNKCSAVNFSTVTKSPAPTTLITYFGDGTGDTSALSPGDPGTMYASVAHGYAAPGTYSVKEVLYHGATAVDSTVFSYRYLLCNNISVAYYFDANGDCRRDSGESYSFQPVTTEVDSNGVVVDTFSSTSGFYYNAIGNPGDIFTFKVIHAPAGFAPTCSGSWAFSDTLQTFTYNVVTNNVGFSCSAAPGFDLAENATQETGMYEASGNIIVTNSYCTPQDAVVTMNIDVKYVFGSSSPSPSSVVGNTVTWNFSALSVNSTARSVFYTLTAAGGSLVPGDTVHTSYSITPLAGDLDPTNNTSARTDTVRASYDPNELSVIPSGYILPGTTLEYAVNFENTGNDTARNIAIMDTLPGNANLNSLRIVAASAAMKTAIYNDGTHNILKFDFGGINLPDSSHHNQCRGTVIFSIKTNTGLADGTTLFNYAGIFFDDNTVVMTDTVENIISLIHGADVVCAGSRITLTDLAASGTWSASNANATISHDTVTAVTAGIDTFTYTVITKYGPVTTSKIVTINAIPTPVPGIASLCAFGGTTTLSDATAGGAWSSTDITIGSAGAITAGAAGTASVSYTLPNGCYTSTTITVNPLPAPIAGTTTVCAGAGATLTDITTGGSWISAAPAVAAVGSDGSVTALSAGTAAITYTLPTGCAATATVTVNAAPAPMTGTAAECSGSNTPLSDASPGGTWSSSAAGTATVTITGVVTGLLTGTVIISYTLPSTCYTTIVNTVNPLPSPITGAGGVCIGSATSLTVTPAGGNWMSSNAAVATADAGVLNALSPGTADITYTLATGCSSSMVVTVNTTPGAITGVFTLCAGSITNLSDLEAGGTWNSSTPGIATVATIGASTGVVIGISGGLDTLSYIVTPGCIATTVVTVYAVPALTVTATSAGCGRGYDLTASGALSYLWAPAAGIACGTCTMNTVDPMATTIYTVTGTSPEGCAATGTITVNANRITGHVIASGAITDIMKVWLMQFNPADSSLITQDSMLTCSDGGIPYYEFDGVVAGNYLVRARLVGSVPGISGYAPSYGLSSPYWDTASVIVHASATDTQHISMIHGNVPAGPGAISGSITTDAATPVAGLLVYLMNATNQVLTYTYTDAAGAYAFSGLANGSYFIYPEAYKYYTTESAAVPLSPSEETATGVSFIQNIARGTITPYSSLSVAAQTSTAGISVFPNPTSGKVSIAWRQQAGGDAAVIITDVAGREVYHSSIDVNVASGQTQIDISALKEGIYILSVRSASIDFNCKLLVD